MAGPARSQKTNPPLTMAILGGMGPRAAVRFLTQVLDATPAEQDSDHLRVLLDNNVRIPDRCRAVYFGDTDPVPAMIASIRHLAGGGADFVCVPCNTAHYFHSPVSAGIPIPWLSMIDLVGAEVNRRHARVLVLASELTTDYGLYDHVLRSPCYPNRSDRRIVLEAIDAVKRGRIPASIRRELDELMSKFNSADAVLLGCTELSVLHALHPFRRLPVVDSSSIYATEAVRYALGAESNQANDGLAVG
jgi:aspartate racemase